MTFKKISFLLIFFLSIIFLNNLQIYKKFFVLLTKNPEKRLIDYHGYCGGESVGFIMFLYKKYNFKLIPKILNFDKMVPDNYWSIFKFNRGIRSNNFNYEYLILLNYNTYNKKNVIKFGKKKINLKDYKIIENKQNCFLLKLL